MARKKKTAEQPYPPHDGPTADPTADPGLKTVRTTIAGHEAEITIPSGLAKNIEDLDDDDELEGEEGEQLLLWHEIAVSDADLPLHLRPQDQEDQEELFDIDDPAQPPQGLDLVRLRLPCAPGYFAEGLEDLPRDAWWLVLARAAPDKGREEDDHFAVLPLNAERRPYGGELRVFHIRHRLIDPSSIIATYREADGNDRTRRLQMLSWWRRSKRLITPTLDERQRALELAAKASAEHQEQTAELERLKAAAKLAKKAIETADAQVHAQTRLASSGYPWTRSEP